MIEHDVSDERFFSRICDILKSENPVPPHRVSISRFRDRLHFERKLSHSDIKKTIMFYYHTDYLDVDVDEKTVSLPPQHAEYNENFAIYRYIILNDTRGAVT